MEDTGIQSSREHTHIQKPTDNIRREVSLQLFHDKSSVARTQVIFKTGVGGRYVDIFLLQGKKTHSKFPKEAGFVTDRAIETTVVLRHVIGGTSVQRTWTFRQDTCRDTGAETHGRANGHKHRSKHSSLSTCGKKARRDAEK